MAKKNRRVILGILSLCLLVAGGLIFRSFLFEYLVMPLAWLFWYLLRLLVFSIHQAVLWYLIIGFICVLFITRYLLKGAGASQSQPHIPVNIHMEKLRSLDRAMALCNKEKIYQKYLIEELRLMLASQYAAEKRLSINYVLFDKFENREIALPEEIFTFLFKKEDKNNGRATFSQTDSFNNGKDAEFRNRVEGCLTWLENRMENESGRNHKHGNSEDRGTVSKNH
jgi:hypothetical protein